MKRRKKEKIESIAEEFRNTATPACAHFGHCGGCLFQDIAIEHQREIKLRYLNDLFAGLISFGSVTDGGEYGYRNRMDYVAAFGRRGLRVRGRYKEVVDIMDCPLLQKKGRAAWSQIRALTAEMPDYDYLKHEGILRYIVMREGRNSGQLMVNFVLAERNEAIEEKLDSLSADSASVILHPGLADISFGDVVRHFGEPSIIETLGRVKFRIYPNSFFQSNSYAAEKAYARIREHVRGRVLDLYSGVGSISLFVADKADSVTGVETVAEAVAAADENRALNETENCRFICADVRPYLKEHGGSYDTVILDPPRSGMHPKVFRELKTMAPETIIYMSCNPSALRTEMEHFDGYEIIDTDVFDMFPQTPHVEALVVFRKRA